MAGQVWLVVSLCSIVGVVPILASPDRFPQVLYNPDGTTNLEIIDTGIAGQARQRRLSWQTPDASQVWIQYPVNKQGRVPWTPAQFTYSVVSNPNLQVVSPSNNQEQSLRSNRRVESRVPALAQSLPNESEYDYDYEYIEEAFFENQPIIGSSDRELPKPVMDKFTGPVMDKFPGPVMEKFPGPVMEKFPGRVMDKFPGQVMDKFPGLEMDKFPGPEMDKFPGPEMDKFPGSEMDKFPGPVMDKFPGPDVDTFSQIFSIDDRVLPNLQMEKFPGPVMEKFPGPVMDKFPGPVMDKFPGPVMDMFPGPVMDNFPGPVMDKFPGPEMDKFPGPEMDKFPGPVMEKFPGPVMDKFPGPVMDKFPGPVMDKFPGLVMDNFPGPVMDKFPGSTERPIQTTSVRNRFTLPFTTTTSRSVPITESRVTPFPTIVRDTPRTRPMMNKFPGPAELRVTPIPTIFRDTPRTRPMMNKFSGPEESRVTPSTTERTVLDKFPVPMMNKFPGPMMNKFPGPVMDTTDEENISVTESVFENIVTNELDSTNFVETDEQIEDTTELGPVIRLTSRGRPQSFTKPAKIIRSEAEKQSTTQKSNQFTTQNQNNRPAPQLLIDPTLRQSNIVQPNTRENTDNSFRFRKPENNQLVGVNNENRVRTRRPGVRRFRTGSRNQGIRRRIVSDNVINIPSTDFTLPTEDIARGAARSLPRTLRFRNRRPATQ